MSVDEYERNAERYLEALESALKRQTASSRTWEVLFGDFLALTEAPPPDPELAPFFADPQTLRELARILPVPFSRRLRDSVDRVAPYRGRETTGFRVRRLSALGLYPNTDASSGRAWYTIRHSTPYLVTLNSAREEARWSSGSELSDWTRHETRMAAALSVAEWGGFTIYLGQYGNDFATLELEHVDTTARIPFMIEYVRLTENVHSHYRYGYWQRRNEPVGQYEFGDFRPHEATARRFAANFLISHQLLLRTARHWLKGAMLWRTEGFSEDALAATLFALEGCLLLFQDAEGGQTDRLDRRLLRAVFQRTFEHGDLLYNFIEDAMGWGGTRALLVHPQLALAEGWTPFVMADDYYEYERATRALLTYFVTGTSTFEGYELAT